MLQILLFRLPPCRQILVINYSLLFYWARVQNSIHSQHNTIEISAKRLVLAKEIKPEWLSGFCSRVTRFFKSENFFSTKVFTPLRREGQKRGMSAIWGSNIRTAPNAMHTPTWPNTSYRVNAVIGIYNPSTEEEAKRNTHHKFCIAVRRMAGIPWSLTNVLKGEPQNKQKKNHRWHYLGLLSAPMIGDWRNPRVEGMSDIGEGTPLPTKEIILVGKNRDSQGKKYIGSFWGLAYLPIHFIWRVMWSQYKLFNATHWMSVYKFSES